MFDCSKYASSPKYARVLNIIFPKYKKVLFPENITFSEQVFQEKINFLGKKFEVRGRKVHQVAAYYTTKGRVPIITCPAYTLAIKQSGVLKKNIVCRTGVVTWVHSVKREFLKISQNVQEKTCAGVFFLQSCSFSTWNFIEKETLVYVSSFELGKNFQNKRSPPDNCFQRSVGFYYKRFQYLLLTIFVRYIMFFEIKFEQIPEVYL